MWGLAAALMLISASRAVIERERTFLHREQPDYHLFSLTKSL